jgi:hypothetical protein
MKSLWNYGIARMFELADATCKTTIDQEIYEFKGFLDQSSDLVQDDRGVQFVEHNFKLTVQRQIATIIPRDVKHQIMVNGEAYTVRQILLTDDGETCEIYLTKVNAYSNSCNSPEGCQ